MAVMSGAAAIGSIAASWLLDGLCHFLGHYYLINQFSDAIYPIIAFCVLQIRTERLEGVRTSPDAADRRLRIFHVQIGSLIPHICISNSIYTFCVKRKHPFQVPYIKSTDCLRIRA